ncbi:MAG TPA: polysaccharide biosynthesis/export family protein [Bryobacteraceae bacterium]|nr:polysaccharide biosynthesis/export family protein [Bryobacteraceae bacterium]
MSILIALLFAASLVGAQDRLPTASPGGLPNLPARPIRPNDLLSVAVYGAPELTRTVRVSSEGQIRLPMLKRQIAARGLMPFELETKIADELGAEEILVDPAVTVTIAEYNSLPISVAGAVRQPLTFQAYKKTTLLEALTRAQGLNQDAGPEIIVTRPAVAPGQAPEIERIPVKGLLDGADPALNIELEGGEEVRVPEVGHVFVAGNVRKPGAFQIEGGSEMSVLKALAMAEGLAPFSSKEAFIYRRAYRRAADANQAAPAKEIAVNLRKILDRKTPDVALESNDILYIPDSRRAKATATALEKIVSFAAGTASGALILSVNR